MVSPLRVAVAGLGGFARAHHDAVEALEQEGVCRLVATCDPACSEMSGTIEELRLSERGARVYRTLAEMLGEEVDVVTLPTPIPLHAEQHQAVVASGAACYLEKPPTLWWKEYGQMLESEKQARQATNVGFNFVGDPLRRELKARILAGEFGRPHGASMLAIWPRDRAYYRRNDWAGRRSVRGKPVMDSPIGNAVSHFVQDLLFWCGCDSVESVAEVESVQTRLFHAHPIESFDTAFVQADLGNGTWLRIGATHCGLDRQYDRETVICEDATITFDAWNKGRIVWRDGRTEELISTLTGYGAVMRENLRWYLEYLTGSRPRPITTLEDCRSFVALHSLAVLATGEIDGFDEGRIFRDDGSGRVGVSGLDEQLHRFVDSGVIDFALGRASSKDLEAE